MSATAGTCPNGHVSGDAEWCDTCGAPMAGQSANATPPAPPSPMTPTDPSGPAIAPVSCPHCGSMNAADNLFCESCGYDFTTGQVPEPVAGSTVAAADPSGLGGVAAPSTEPAAGSAPPVPGWVVIVEVDPEWHAIKGELADRPLPDPSTSTVPQAGTSASMRRSRGSQASKRARSTRPKRLRPAPSACSRS